VVEEWSGGGMEWWRNGVVEEWSGGGMEWWRNGVVEEWGDGGMEWWRNGEMEEWSGGGMEWWRNGEMEEWSGGFELPPLFRHSIVSTVDAIRFVDDQCFGPRTGIAFSFQRFDQAQKAVFEFECLVIENFEIVFGKLTCPAVGVVAGHTLPERA
jgi:hypothetical protein